MGAISLAADRPARDFPGRVITADTIAAISTPPGEGAVAVIRVSGPDSARILGAVFSTARPLALPRTLCCGRVTARDGTAIDSAMAAFFPAPKSSTGESVAEIHCHGGVFVSARVLEAVLEAGARAAEPGEFTRRAFLNGKMDLTRAEAVMDVIRARTPPALRAAQEQLSGGLGRQFSELRAGLLALVANIEAWIDFPDEDIDPATGGKFERALLDALDAVGRLLETAAGGRVLREGVGLVLCGPPNAGKSSLLNQLLGCDRAIVAVTPGTTRDTIEESANLGGILFRITDTAGLRQPGDPVEALGIERTNRAIAAADLVLHVVDVSTGPPPPPPGSDREFLALNKIDLLASPPPGIPGRSIPVSCATGAGIPALIGALIQAVPQAPPTGAAINARHQACLQHARDALGSALGELRAGRSPEFIAPGLHEALEAVGEILGVADAEEILGAVFSRFCIGK
jgi:tRNA modification GTPase